MLRDNHPRIITLFAVIGMTASAVLAQSAAPSLDAVRGLGTIGASEQRVIDAWLESQVSKLDSSSAKDAFKILKEAFDAERLNQGNSAAFIGAMAAGTARMAEQRLPNSGPNSTTARAIARMLFDLNREQAVPGFIAGLKSQDQGARYFSAAGLGQQRGSIATARARVTEVVTALKAAGIAETSPTIIKQIYGALAYEPITPEIFDAYLGILDRRIEARRQGAFVVDGAEVQALEYLRKRSVLDGLSRGQSPQLVGRLAVLLRLDAQRYVSDTLPFAEKDPIERQLFAVEEILTTLTSQTGEIAAALRAEGHDNRVRILAETLLWVGDPETGTEGRLSAAPWNVPIGAP